MSNVGLSEEVPATDQTVDVIIVGLGIVGLTAAIECREKGHRVTAYEKSDVLKPAGTIFKASV